MVKRLYIRAEDIQLNTRIPTDNINIQLFTQIYNNEDSQQSPGHTKLNTHGKLSRAPLYSYIILE